MNCQVMRILKLLQVTEANMNLMKQLILNGADKHPGANFIQQRQTNIRK